MIFPTPPPFFFFAHLFLLLLFILLLFLLLCSFSILLSSQYNGCEELAGPRRELYAKVAEATSDLQRVFDAIPQDSPSEAGRYIVDQLVPQMKATRAAHDKAEEYISAAFYPYPDYEKMLCKVFKPKMKEREKERKRERKREEKERKSGGGTKKQKHRGRKRSKRSHAGAQHQRRIMFPFSHRRHFLSFFFLAFFLVRPSFFFLSFFLSCFLFFVLFFSQFLYS